jgi:hypothetical protein
MTTIRTYRELRRFPTFEERYEYLRIGGTVGFDTFGFDRHVNQAFYRSTEWKRTRERVIVRDNGCDLGVPGYEIHSGLLVHHINPMVAGDIIHNEDWILEPDYLITTTHNTHNAIHYGDATLLSKPYVPRSRGDTKLW